MPYIAPESRAILDSGADHPLVPGELNYVITTIISKWLGPTPNYVEINAAIGVLECAKLELYRRVAAPYEDGKIAENGDVYDCAPNR